MKKVLIFLVGCAACYACWTAFFKQDTEEAVAVEEVAEVPADTTISEIKGINELPEDTMSIDSVMPAK